LRQDTESERPSDAEFYPHFFDTNFEASWYASSRVADFQPPQKFHRLSEYAVPPRWTDSLNP
jgi:hypothetical protein